MWELIIITPLVLVAILYAQKKHYEFMERKQGAKRVSEVSAQMEKTLKEFDDYKKRVDVLILKAGLKL